MGEPTGGVHCAARSARRPAGPIEPDQLGVPALSSRSYRPLRRRRLAKWQERRERRHWWAPHLNANSGYARGNWHLQLTAPSIAVLPYVYIA
jgi:hypothetical protein